MSLFRRSRSRSLRAVVLGLDGTPYSLVRRLMEEGRMPNLAALARQGTLLPMTSVLPTVSSVAWASITTGCNPGKHGLFGLIDRVPLTDEMFIPNAKHLLKKSWVELISGLGRQVFSLGVPSTYPPKAINGILISGFLAPNLKEATYPLQISRELEELGYVIDIDAWHARENTEAFLDEVFQALERRLEAVFRFWNRQEWDLIVTHILETDRLHHFLWGFVEDEDERYLPWFHRFYDRIDQAIGEIVERIDDETLLFVLSDHGFVKVKQEVHMNLWLREAGYLEFDSPRPKQLRDLSNKTRCYSLLPGRFYLRLQGREREGSVAAGPDYKALREEIAEGILAIRDPETGEAPIESVWMREDIYEGEAADLAPDFVARPRTGYDLKGGFEKDLLMERGPVNGTHRYDDAMLLVNRRFEPSIQEPGLVDVLPTLFSGLGLEVPPYIDGQSLIFEGS